MRIALGALWLEIIDDHHQVPCQVGEDGRSWRRIDDCTGVSGLNHNAHGGCDSLRSGLFALAEGEAASSRFVDRPLPP